ALCRGSVRRCNGDQCDPCDAYVIASVRSGIPKVLPDIFPGCKIVRWQPVERDLRGHVKAAVEMIEGHFRKIGGERPIRCTGNLPPISTLAFKAVSKALGITPHDFRNNVRKHPEFIEAIAEAGIVEWGKGARFTGFAM